MPDVTTRVDLTHITPLTTTIVSRTAEGCIEEQVSTFSIADLRTIFNRDGLGKVTDMEHYLEV